MSRNIKEIGKELLGKSLNSFHRKTGLTQLEENNKMQDGILDGILSQVDDAYIEKTEQSNVIHLEGSGDGVVVLDSIEGNTMVNLIITNMKNFEVVSNNAKNFDVVNLKPSTTYTFVAHLKDVSSTNMWLARFHFNKISDNSELYINVAPHQTYTSNSVVKYSFTTPNNDYVYKRAWALWSSTLPSGEKMSFYNALILEGDWTDKEVPIDLQGLQSSFEEKVNDEGKYEIEILSNNKNLFDMSKSESGYIEVYTDGNIGNVVRPDCLNRTSEFIKVKPSTMYTYIATVNVTNGNYATWNRIAYYDKNKNYITNVTTYGESGLGKKTDITKGTTPSNCEYVRVGSRYLEGTDTKVTFAEGDHTEHIELKQNKIKLLLNSPLLEGDRLEIKDDKLYHYHKRKLRVLNGDNNEPWVNYNCLSGTEVNTKGFSISYNDILQSVNTEKPWTHMCDKLPTKKQIDIWNTDSEGISTTTSPTFRVRINRSKASTVNELKTYLSLNPMTICYELAEPYYEEVLNEYGEPILLEGYENGTIYIDSTIVPTTTVRYTPKMESFKTLNEVNNNNIMLTNDIDDNIIPYMMDVDLMIMEKEMALMSHKNIRTIGVKDMTSMQKRTQDMLERLIKGKTLTEQECKTRVTTYLNAGKITDAQAEELNFLIDEIYA